MTMTTVLETLRNHGERLSCVETSEEKNETRVQSLDDRITIVDGKIDSLKFWIMTTLATAGLGLLGTVVTLLSKH